MATATRKPKRKGKDATAELIELFADHSQWDHVEERVPIFVEHEAWEVPQADGTKALRMVLPGQEKPKEGRMLYAVDAEKIRQTAANIQQNLDDYRKPMKLFVGHSDPRKPQEENPDIVGYGVGAEVGTWGPGNAAAIFTTNYYKPGTFDQASKYPERSPEFFPNRNLITGIALLKTDPRLPMGMLPYGERNDFCVCYGQGFDLPDDPDADNDNDDDPTVNPAETATDAPASDAAPAPAPDAPGAEGDLELSPEEAQTAMRYMSHYERHHPVMKYACEQFRAMQETQPAAGAAPAPAMPSPTNGSLPGAGDEEKKDMANTAEIPVQYAERLKTAETQLHEMQTRYAESEARRIVGTLVNEGFRIKDAKKLRERMAKLDDAGRKALADEVRENYAQDERPPVSNTDAWIAADDSPLETYREPSAVEMNQIVRYAEDHDLDMENDAEYRKACAAVLGK